MVLKAFDSALEGLSRRLRRSGVPAFLRWWARELQLLMPERVRALFADSEHRLIVRPGAGAHTLSGLMGRSERWRSDVEGPPEELRAILKAKGSEWLEAKGLRVILPADQVLRRALELPAAVEDNLERVAGFEIDRQTPFRADQAIHAARVVSRDSSSGMLRVELIVARREQVERASAWAAALATPLEAIDIDLDDGPAFVNLLPQDLRPRPALGAGLRVVAALAVIALLIYGLAAQIEQRRMAQIELLQARIADIQIEARQASEVREQVESALEAASFLRQRRAAKPTFPELLADLTERLPDSVYLSRLVINGDELQITGLAPEASRLISILSRSDYLDRPRLNGPVQPDPRTGKESFTIAAAMRAPPVPTPGVQAVAQQGAKP